jgi:hypothetical protein
MPKKKVIDSEKLIQAVESKQPSKKIMEQFKIKTSAQLKSLYLDALVAKGRVEGLVSKTGRGAGNADKSKDILVNKRGSLVIPKEVIAEMGFQIDDAFKVRKTKSGVSIKKV